MSTWKGIVGRKFRPQEFKAYVSTLTFTDWRPQFVVVHNTSEPRLSQWHSTPGEQRMLNLQDYYIGQKWSAGPHLFIADDFIWVFTPLTTSGVHSPSWNALSWGVEMVGEYEEEAFGPAVSENTVDALAILHGWRGLDPHAVRFHKEDPRTTHKECPGCHVDKASLIARVLARMADGADGEHAASRLAGAGGGGRTQFLVPSPIPAATTTPPPAAASPASMLPALPTGTGTVVAAAATTAEGGVALEVSVPSVTVGTPAPAPAPAPGTTGRLQSKLLAGDPTLEKVATGETVFVASTPPTRQAGVGKVQDALNLLAKQGEPAMAIDLDGGLFRGFYGRKTKAAVRVFQKAQGLDDDGCVGEKTIRKLDAALLALEAHATTTKPADPAAPVEKKDEADLPGPVALPAAPVEREMVHDSSIRIFKLKDRPGFYYQGCVMVDADGSPRCYHPDPGSGKGLDALANSTSDSRKFIQGENGVGPAPGFYVSQTSLQSGPEERCDSFVDAETIPYMVFFGRKKFPAMQLGDVGMVVSLETGKRSHVIIADGNNNTKGEVSVQTAKNLGVNPSPRRGGDDHFNYVYLMFPGTKFTPVQPAPHWPEDKIKEVAEAAFRAWGGMATLRRCFPRLPTGAV